jgi:hypothetical protein
MTIRTHGEGSIGRLALSLSALPPVRELHLSPARG